MKLRQGIKSVDGVKSLWVKSHRAERVAEPFRKPHYLNELEASACGGKKLTSLPSNLYMLRAAMLLCTIQRSRACHMGLGYQEKPKRLNSLLSFKPFRAVTQAGTTRKSQTIAFSGNQTHLLGR